MQEQSEIKRTLKQQASIEAVRQLLAGKGYETRASFADSVCGHFGFLDTRERPQRAGCVKALKELEQAGHFVLPAALHRGGTFKSPRRLGQPVAAAIDVPAQAGDVGGLRLVIVEQLDLMRVWNELMLCEHPQGAGPLVGAQMRYLIDSEHGWLGGFGFGAAALQMADRDQWIGWNSDLRRQQMHRVVGMSRFLLRNSVDCQNLASMVQGMVLRRLGADYEARYGYRPWLVESFVDTEQFIGTSYRAANWLQIGQTRGRGRQDREHEHAKTVKTIYVYPLEADWRKRMGVGEPVPLAMVAPIGTPPAAMTLPGKPPPPASAPQ